MEDHRLKAFCLVVEMRSFSKAAEAKFMTQSAMSHLIKNLEDEIGARLLNRQGKSVTPTRAGRALYDHAKRIIEQYKTMENDVYAIAQKIKGPLSIGASSNSAACLLPQVFYGFLKTYPDVIIDISVSNTEKIIMDIHEGKIDIGVVEGNIKNPSVFLDDIAEDEIVIIASDDNPLTKNKSLNQNDLLSQPFLMPEAGSGIREFIDDFFSKSQIDPKNLKIPMTLGNTELIIQMAQAGMGIAFVSKWSAFRAIKEGSIRVLNISGRKLKRKFYVASAEKEQDSLTAKTFKNFIKDFNFFVPF